MTATMLFLPITQTAHGEPLPDASIEEVSISTDVRMTDVVVNLGDTVATGDSAATVTIEREAEDWVVRTYAREREEPLTVSRINATTGEPA